MSHHTSHDIRRDYARRMRKSAGGLGGPAFRNPEEVAVEMILEERENSRQTLLTYIAGAEAEKAQLLRRIQELEGRS